MNRTFKYKVAIIGCGRISSKHIQSITRLSDTIELVSCCDLIKERATNAAMHYHNMNPLSERPPAVYEDYKDMLEKEDIDIVSICTDSSFHAPISIYCLNNKKHIIVEKPMALSIQDAEKMNAVAISNKVKLCVSHQNRFNPAIQKVRKAVETNKFGRIYAINARILWNRDEDYYKQALWRGTYLHDGGCLMNQCIHNIDLLQWMVECEMEWVHGIMSNYSHPYIEVEDYGSIQLKFKNGTIGNVEGTVCVYPENLEETLTILGEKGTAVIGGLAVNKLLTWKFSDESICESIFAENSMEIDSVYGEGHTSLYKDMVSSILNDKEPYINGKAGIKALEIILAAYESNRIKARVYYPLPNLKSEDYSFKK